jgi:tetratricopeptide (TPR) repeat protein
MPLEGLRESERGEIEHIEGGRKPMASDHGSGDLAQLVIRLLQRVGQLHEQARYQEAIVPAVEARDLARQYLGENDPLYAASLNKLAALYRGMGDYAAAMPLFHQALVGLLGWSRRKAGGASGTEVESLLREHFRSVATLTDQRRWDEALPLAQRAADLARLHLGEDHPGYARSLGNLGRVHEALGDYAAALPLYQRAAEITRAALGEAHTGYAASLNDLGRVHEALGDYAAALNDLGRVREALGDYAAALLLYQRAVEVLEAYTPLGEDLPAYAAALPLYQRAVEALRVALGEAHPGYAMSLQNLAGVHRALGDYAAALPLYQRAAEIIRAALGEAHPGYAASLNDLGRVHEALGDYAAALLL